MPEPVHTSFAGLIRIPPGESLSADGYEFQYFDPVVIDNLLKLGALSHKHDGAAALASPAVAPTLALKITGGSIPAGETLTLGYTLVDEDGGETLISPSGVVTTAGGVPDPATAPTAVPSYAAGALLAANYTYAVTVTDGKGGETALSPSVSVVVEAHAKGEVTVSGLKAIMEAVGGSEWRLWRVQNGGLVSLIAHGTGASIIDDGTLVPDCTVAPPLVSTTTATNTLEVTVPSPGAGRATFIRLYGTTTGSYGGVSLLGEYPISEAGKVIAFLGFAPGAGMPPPVTRAHAHANKINPDTDMIEWPWRRPVKKVSELPTLGNSAGDIRLVEENKFLYEWDSVGKKWDQINGLKGETGLTGEKGTTGTTGENGLTILNGSGAPAEGLGINGDFYINTSIWYIYGPKAAGVWPAGVPLATGPAGPKGEEGKEGKEGPAGSLAIGAPTFSEAVTAGTEYEPSATHDRWVILQIRPKKTKEAFIAITVAGEPLQSFKAGEQATEGGVQDVVVCFPVKKGQKWKFTVGVGEILNAHVNYFNLS